MESARLKLPLAGIEEHLCYLGLVVSLPGPLSPEDGTLVVLWVLKKLEQHVYVPSVLAQVLAVGVVLPTLGL